MPDLRMYDEPTEHGADDYQVRYSIIADGAYWEDSDGNDEWDELDAIALRSSLELMGYDAELI